jgi:hypothetical protein
MSQPTSPAAAERPAEPLVYRPVSGLAIAGFILSALYAALVVFTAVVALIRREPFFLPTWMHALAAGGVVLSFLALRQIRVSEGTRAGTPLARWGLWLSVLCGLGTVVFSGFTGLAVRTQANSFLTEKGPDGGFFPLLEEGTPRGVNAAFLLARPPEARRQANPNNDPEMEKVFDIPLDPMKDPRGGLTIFRSVDFVQLLGQHGTANEIVPAGDTKWDYDAKGYAVSRTYRIRNPEGEFDLKLKVQSVESGTPGEGRKWMVLWAPMHPPVSEVSLTPLGKTMQQLRTSAALFGNVWLFKLHAGALFEVHADLLDPKERAHLRPLHMWHVKAGVAATLTAAPGSPRHLLLPTFCEMATAGPSLRREAPRGDTGVFDTQRFHVRGHDRKFQDGILSAIAGLNSGRVSVLRSQPRVIHDPTRAYRYERWQKKDGRLEIALDVILDIQPFPQVPTEQATVFGKLIVSADAAADPATSQDRLWRVVRLEIDLAVPKRPTPLDVPGPGGPGGPRPFGPG